MHFRQLGKAHNGHVLTLDGQPIPVVKTTKFLGVIFDPALTDAGIKVRNINANSEIDTLSSTLNTLNS